MEKFNRRIELETECDLPINGVPNDGVKIVSNGHITTWTAGNGASAKGYENDNEECEQEGEGEDETGGRRRFTRRYAIMPRLSHCEAGKIEIKKAIWRERRRRKNARRDGVEAQDLELNYWKEILVCLEGLSFTSGK